MAYDFSNFKKASESALEWLKKEYGGIRAGRAAPGILDNVSVSAYGAPSPISQVATVTIEGPKSLRITPWDKSLMTSIDAAIRESNLGLSVSIDDTGLRVSFPELSSERRTQLLKLAKDKLEEARITLRGEREKVQRDLEQKEKAGDISEDEKFRYKAELQKLVDEANKRLDSLEESKEKEIQE